MEVKRTFAGNLLMKFSGNSRMGKTVQAGLGFFAGYLLTYYGLHPIRQWQVDGHAKHYKEYAQNLSGVPLFIASWRKEFCERWMPNDPERAAKYMQEIKICDEVTEQMNAIKDEILARIEEHRIV